MGPTYVTVWTMIAMTKSMKMRCLRAMSAVKVFVRETDVDFVRAAFGSTTVNPDNQSPDLIFVMAVIRTAMAKSMKTFYRTTRSVVRVSARPLAKPIVSTVKSLTHANRDSLKPDSTTVVLEIRIATETSMRTVYRLDAI